MALCAPQGKNRGSISIFRGATGRKGEDMTFVLSKDHYFFYCLHLFLRLQQVLMIISGLTSRVVSFVTIQSK